MANRLANETSPYLLQHAHNPVDWYPWGEEALARARAEDRPILLSVGYSACHWCHVMERESFEDPAIAAQMNAQFVNIKVDREERPDIDSIYMQAVQAMTGRGGWPMTVFLFPDGTPFYGGTYYPPQDRQGMPGFPRVLAAIAGAYRDRKAELADQGRNLVAQMSGLNLQEQQDSMLSTKTLDAAFVDLAERFDARLGGFGGAPKFPQPMQIDVLLRHHHRTGDVQALPMAETTLRAMANGGMYDQAGGGFHRYSTDAHWLVPHFEKMLYDNALLAPTYIDAFLVTGNVFYRRIATETLDYVLREMSHESGAFYSTQDADSEGEEGKFFTWSRDEFDSTLVPAVGQENAAHVAAFYGITDAGNFEGKTILHVAVEAVAFAKEHGVEPEEFLATLEAARGALYAARERRVHPGRDEKVLTSWNGMMLKAFARASRVIDVDGRYLAAARANADFLRSSMIVDGRVLRTWKDGAAKLLGYLEDYACLADGLIATYEATFEARYLAAAVDLAHGMVELFWDAAEQVFYDTGADHETLVARPRDIFDNATPSGTSTAADVLLRLAAFTGDAEFESIAESVLLASAPFVERVPSAFGRLLCALDFHLAATKELAVVWPAGGDPAAMLDVAFGAFRPHAVVAGGDEAAAAGAASITPLLGARTAREGLPTAYLCERFVCQAPTTDAAVVAAELAGA